MGKSNPEDLLRSFGSAFGSTEPSWLIRTPGRINLIGEHTDYNGFPVMPVAIDRAVYVAVAPRDDGLVKLKNVQGADYGPREFALQMRIPPHPQGDWANYIKAAVQEILLRHPEGLSGPQIFKGFSCLIDGDIPPASGLSSSSALVVAGALAFCAVNEIEIPRQELASLLAEAEHYVGTRGGGMDQAICLLAQEGHVLKIDFFPLRTAPAPFPEDYCILAAHSTVPAAKTESQMQAYNRRVLECKLGTALLRRTTENPNAERLADLVAEGTGWVPYRLTDALSDILHGQRETTIDHIADILDSDREELQLWLRSETDLEDLPDASEGVKVLPRCKHVFSEARRVDEAFESLQAGNPSGLGRLMNESHRSCAEDYEISCTKLDRLVVIMQEAGAAGARLTGAGFGGFAIGLVSNSAKSEVRDRLRKGFYEPKGLDVANHVFRFTPQAGASVTKL